MKWLNFPGFRKKTQEPQKKNREKKEQSLIEKMDLAMIGPELHCEYCGHCKVLSPCYSCQHKHIRRDESIDCRGCGQDYRRCKRQRNICCVEIGRLTNLSYFDLRDNQLTKLPAEIGKLTNLKELLLSKNQLIKLPTEISKLTNLTHLSLDNNQLKELPIEICKLANLKELNLGGNQITKLPAEIGMLTNLIRLSLSVNKITELPVEISKLKNLNELWIISNPIEANKDKVKELKELFPRCQIISAARLD